MITDKMIGEAEGNDGRDDPGLGRQLFRLFLGLAADTPGRVHGVLRAFEASAPPAPPAALPSVRHLIFGALSALPQAVASAHLLLAPVAKRGRPWARRLVPRALRTRGAAWTAMGLAEETAGRRLFESALHAIPSAVLATAAASPELRETISQQTAGITRSALGRLRQSSARADDASEAITQRLLRRRRRDPGISEEP